MQNSVTIKLSPSKKDKLIQEKLHPVEKRVVDALSRLNSLKTHRMEKYWRHKNEYAQRETLNKQEDWFVEYTMNTWFAIVNSKASDILSNTAKYDFVALDDEAKKYRRIRELFWKYVWQVSRTDKELDLIVTDAMKYWVWFWEEIIVDKKRLINKPKKVGWMIEYSSEVVTEYRWCKLNHLPYSQVYLNWSNIENTTEAIVINYWDRDEFLNIFWLDDSFHWISDDNIPKGKYYYIGQWANSITIGWSPSITDRSWNTVESENIVSVLTYYNKYRDEYIVLANNKWINPLKSINAKWAPQENIQPIPYPHKEIPILVYTDHIIDDDIYWVGEFDITEKSRKLKNTLRSLFIEGIKAQAWMTTIDPDSEFDETVMKLWIWQIARVEKDAIGFYAPNINLSWIAQQEAKVEEDLIVETWVDYRAQLFSPNETAEKTKWRIAAAKKVINHNTKSNAWTFFERLWRLRSANIDFFYSEETSKLPIEWVDVSSNGATEYLQSWYWLFTMKPEYFKWKLALIPIVDSLVWDNSSERKQKYIETLQLLMNMKNPDGTPVYDPKALVESWRGLIDDVIDLDKISWKSAEVKSPEDLMKSAWIWDSNQAPAPEQGWIPPSQQSWRPILLGSSPIQ